MLYWPRGFHCAFLINVDRSLVTKCVLVRAPSHRISVVRQCLIKPGFVTDIMVMRFLSLSLRRSFCYKVCSLSGPRLIVPSAAIKGQLVKIMCFGTD